MFIKQPEVVHNHIMPTGNRQLQAHREFNVRCRTTVYIPCHLHIWLHLYISCSSAYELCFSKSVVPSIGHTPVISNHVYSYHEDWTQRHVVTNHGKCDRRTYSVQCSDKVCFPQFCGVSKSCPGTHTALQAPMMSSTVTVQCCDYTVAEGQMLSNKASPWYNLLPIGITWVSKSVYTIDINCNFQVSLQDFNA